LNAVSPNSPKTNGKSSEENNEWEKKPEPKKEEPYTPSNKYNQRKTSQFAQRLAKTTQEIKQPQLNIEQPQQPLEEQPRYRTYLTSR
jgi:hypothetical protein